MSLTVPKLPLEQLRRYAELRLAHRELVGGLVPASREEHDAVLVPLIEFLAEHRLRDLVEADHIVLIAFLDLTDPETSDV